MQASSFGTKVWGPNFTYLSLLRMPLQQRKGPDRKPIGAPGLEWRMAAASVRWQSRVDLKKEKCMQPDTAWHLFWHAKASGSLLKFWPIMSSGNQATLSSKQVGVVVVLVEDIVVVVVLDVTVPVTLVKEMVVVVVETVDVDVIVELVDVTVAV